MVVVAAVVVDEVREDGIVEGHQVHYPPVGGVGPPAEQQAAHVMWQDGALQLARVQAQTTTHVLTDRQTGRHRESQPQGTCVSE